MKLSGAPWTASGMLDLNKRHEAPVRAFLTRLVRDPQAHAKFLNMLAMLEHMGSRKIMASQSKFPETMDEDTLQHLAEEARHAYFFKRHANRIAKRDLVGWTDDNTMERIAAAMYFGRLDAGISKAVKPKSAYGWVSLIIELRACWLYGIYHEILEHEGVHLPLKGLLAEEDGHLEDMFARSGHDTARLKNLCQYELGLFETFWSSLEQSFPQLEDNLKAA